MVFQFSSFLAPGSLLFVVGGYITGTTATTELIDLSRRGLNCSAPSPYPLQVHCASGMISAEGNPISCGGANYEHDPRECHEYRPDNDAWMPTQGLLEDRCYAAVAKLEGAQYWIAGGFYQPGKTELYGDTQSTGPIISTSAYSESPCAVTISDTEVLYVGERSYVFNPEDSTLTQTSSQPFETASGRVCGLAVKSNGEKMVVVTGGYSGTTRAYPVAVQIYTVQPIDPAVAHG